MRNEHFASPADWAAAAALLTFEPRVPSDTAGHALQSLAVQVRDHRGRELPPAARSLEAHYGGFVLAQRRAGADEARRLALEVPYGTAPREATVLGRAARVCEPGPEVPPDDVDGRAPAVVSWHEGEMFFLVASATVDSTTLLRIAMSVHAPGRGPAPVPGPARRRRHRR